MYIAVSGNLSSGKSTIARRLANVFNCDYYPRRSYNSSYIEDLFREPGRWSTEAQISFMVHKHDAIRQGIERGRLFVLDRTFEEDVQVFAEHFHDDGAIDARSMELIRQLASDLHSRLEAPALIVYCDCPVQICEERLRERPRTYQRSYPADHLRKLNERLQSWLERQTDVPVIRVATDRVDYRDPVNVAALARDIDMRLRSGQSNQPDLFGQNAGQTGLPGFDPEFGGPSSSGEGSLLRPKQVYLAAPFTTRATKREIPSRGTVELFSGMEYSESIPRYYRSQLLALARAIEGHGHNVLLPHRDINRWGSRMLPAGEIATQCLHAVAAADYFVGLIAESFGSHAELGYALGLGKPSLVLVSEANPTSFFGTGLAAMDEVAILRATSIPDLIAACRAKDPLSMLTRQAEQ